MPWSESALERIEVAFRAVLSQSMSERHGAHWYMDATLFVPKYRHDKFLDVLKKDIGDDPAKAPVRQTFIQHYYEKYGDPALPPSWMVFEVLSFGTVSQVFKNLLRDHQKPIGKTFGLGQNLRPRWQRAGVMAARHHLLAEPGRASSAVVESCLYDQADCRQAVCRRTGRPDPILRAGRDDRSAVESRLARLKVVSPDTRWGERLAALLAEHPKVRAVRLGFPADWQQRDLWRRT